MKKKNTTPITKTNINAEVTEFAKDASSAVMSGMMVGFAYGGAIIAKDAVIALRDTAAIAIGTLVTKSKEKKTEKEDEEDV